MEHLLPHKNGKYPDRKFDWNNLFWSCGHCNSVKNQEKYDKGIIDCCRQDPEKRIYFSLKENVVEVKAKNSNDQAAVLTAELVREVFDKRNTAMRTIKSEIRFKALNEEMIALYNTLEEWKLRPNSGVVMGKLKALLRRESAFAAFKRNYVRENIEHFPQLERYI